MNKISLLLAASLLTLTAAGTVSALPGNESAPQRVAAEAAKKDIVATAVGAGQFKTLAKALQEADLVKTLQGPGPFTVFAPTDEAFAKLPKGTLEALLKDKAKLKAILTYHVVAGNLKAKDVLGGAPLKTVQGQSLKASKKGDEVKIDNAKVLKTDIECSNGVIHVIDSVVLPK